MLVSFIIAAYNAEKTIGKCLDSVLRQRVKKEILLIDNASSDRTAEIAKRYKGVKCLFEPKRGEPCARNKGLDHARGDYIAFVDSDVILPAGWTSKALKLLRSEKGLSGVGGPGMSADKGLISRIIGARLYGMDKSVKRKYVDSLATMDVVLKREAIEGQRYDESMVLGVDTEFSLRLRKKGHKLLFDSGLYVYHHHPTSLGGLLRKWYRYGTNYPFMCGKHKEMRNAGFFARVTYIPLLITFVALSPFSVLFLYAAFVQLLSLFLFYAYIGVRVSRGWLMLAFPFVQTLKQLAQLTGTAVGLKKLLEV